MTPAQLKALESYISAVAYYMLRQLGAPEVVAARKRLEAAFGYELPTVLPVALPPIIGGSDTALPLKDLL